MRYWFLNAVCGLLVLLLLGLHMGALYLDDLMSVIFGTPGGALDWSNVSGRGQSAMVTLVYVVFLGTALFHGLYGLHTMLTEYWSSRRAARLILSGCWIAGLLLFIVGTVATVTFHFQSQAM